MGHLFSKKKRSSVTEQDRAVLQLKTTRDKIRQYQKRSEALLEKDRELAKKLLLAHKKERAKLLLRKKRFIEDQLQRTDGQLENIERMIQDLEFAQIEIKEISALLCGFAAATGLTEDELDAELDALLQQDSSGDKIPELPSVPEEQLPDVPQEEPSAAAAKSRPQKSPQKRTAVEAS
ncbi:hypothetical protein HAZT_HAZT007143 [Hyalella azteca]|uniref:Charged multivesicular body protein 6 n=1 Tax=Hyalella azteca TaxID=294128 RepID=A0A6A0H1A0_HYAAZ|nr:hypothetical protein HAZT_HAZT007143 [Hyalella azteca]